MQTTFITPIKKVVISATKKIVPGKPFFLNNQHLTQLEQFAIAIDNLEIHLETSGGDFFTWYASPLTEAGYPLVRKVFMNIENRLLQVEDLRTVYKSREIIEQAHRLLRQNKKDEDRDDTELNEKLENLKKNFLARKPRLFEIVNHWVEGQTI